MCPWFFCTFFCSLLKIRSPSSHSRSLYNGSWIARARSHTHTWLLERYKYISIERKKWKSLPIYMHARLPQVAAFQDSTTYDMYVSCLHELGQYETRSVMYCMPTYSHYIPYLNEPDSSYSSSQL